MVLILNEIFSTSLLPQASIFMYLIRDLISIQFDHFTIFLRKKSDICWNYYEYHHEYCTYNYTMHYMVILVGKLSLRVVQLFTTNVVRYSFEFVVLIFSRISQYCIISTNSQFRNRNSK